ncbi:MAG: hypothetical protein ACR5LD_01170 [Symbiopectobacterium sp.]
MFIHYIGQIKPWHD